uniref:ADAMTS cysteine-rich domain-containing protein n=1 Tax=Trichogramma kaykai TaxID=54128 RepID=A0ABD2XEX9_9HYME
MYIAKYDEETEKIKYQAYHYPEPQTKNSCKKEQHQKLSPKEHIESEKTYHEHEDTVYPKILVAVDYSLYKKYGGNVFKIAQVAAAYWNSVDLPYRTIKNPKIRLNIAGLIITENPEAIPYVEKNYNHNLGSFEGNKVLDDMTSHFKDYGKHLDGIPEHSFDTVILMTNRLNIKYWTGVARPNQRFGKDTVGFVTGNFEHSLSTVNTGAHEQGHFKPENKYLRNRPNIGKPHSRVLPGSFATRDQQCQSIGTLLSDNWNLIPSNFAHVPQDKVEDCSVQYCARRNAETNYEAEEIKTVLPPLDGTSCGCGKICFHGECVEDQE